MAAAQLRFSPLPNLAGFRRFPSENPRFPSTTFSLIRSSNPNLSQSLTSPDPPIFPGGINNNNTGGSGSSGGGGNGWNSGDDQGKDKPSNPSGPLGLFLSGWRSRVSADPEFPFKVLMEELVGVTATAIGDMASRPNFGLTELDFVFSTIVVGSIVNFVLMYLLAPTSLTPSTSSSSLPSYIFQPGNFSLLHRLATFFYKGLMFSAVGFAAGLAGTAISNGLVQLRGKKEKEKKKGPPTVLNAATWAVHMGLSSNLRYQTLNGVEFVMAKGMPAGWFKAVVVVLRCLNNMLGGMSFVALGRVMGSQKVEEGEEKESLVGDGELERSDSQSKGRVTRFLREEISILHPCKGFSDPDQEEENQGDTCWVNVSTSR